MATQLDPQELDLQEQLASIKRHMAEIDQRQKETSLEPAKLVVQAGVMIAALLGAGAAVAALFLS